MRGYWFGFALVLAACSSKSDHASPPRPDAACLDRPGVLPRPPQRGLPCELLPPSRQR